MDELYEMDALTVKIDLNALINVAACAVHNAKAVMERYQSEVDNAIYMFEGQGNRAYHQNHHRQFYAKLVAEAAQEYATALQAYFALYEAQSRENLEIVR
jgi:uncharacterized protein YhfF